METEEQFLQDDQYTDLDYEGDILEQKNLPRSP